MTIRKLLVIPLVLSLFIFLFYAREILHTASLVMTNLNVTAPLIGVLIIAVIIQFVGHYFRSKKAAYLLRPIEKSKITTQFRAFSVGQLFNNLLPFRIGELIRAAILAQKLNISFLYSFILIVFERAVDALFLAICGILLILIAGAGFSLMVPLLALALIAIFGILIVVILKLQPKWLLDFVQISTAQLNDSLRDKFRFKVWSVGYGLKKTIEPKLLARYGFYTVLSWVFYFASTAIVAAVILVPGTVSALAAAAIGPYLGVSLPSGPASLGTYSQNISVFHYLLNHPSEQIIVYMIVSWCILVIPISVVGVVLLLTNTKELFWKKRPLSASNISLENKLSRTEDISGDMSAFLNSYFRNNGLSSIVSRLEQSDEFNLVKYFKGGSDAITILVLENGEKTVKKIIPIELKDRLKAQYDWLNKYGGGSIVTVSNEITSTDYYSINVAYDETSISLFEYVHQISTKDARSLLDSVWKDLHKTVYGKIKAEKTDEAATTAYIQKHIYDCLQRAVSVDEEIKRATELEKITVNGIEYDNLEQVLDKIKKNKQAWHDISTFRSARAVHGDVIIDNLLYSKKRKKVIIIDPAPDGNLIEGPVFDFGKAAQSLYCGYEFLLRDESPVTLEEAGVISFSENKSTQYTKLDKYVRSVLASKYLTESERRAVLFHCGVLYLRRLKHQVYYTPENALKFYAVGVRTLNEFLDQY